MVAAWHLRYVWGSVNFLAFLGNTYSSFLAWSNSDHPNPSQCIGASVHFWCSSGGKSREASTESQSFSEKKISVLILFSFLILSLKLSQHLPPTYPVFHLWLSRHRWLCFSFIIFQATVLPFSMAVTLPGLLLPVASNLLLKFLLRLQICAAFLIFPTWPTMGIIRMCERDVFGNGILSLCAVLPG